MVHLCGQENFTILAVSHLHCNQQGYRVKELMNTDQKFTQMEKINRIWTVLIADVGLQNIIQYTENYCLREIWQNQHIWMSKIN